MLAVQDDVHNVTFFVASHADCSILFQEPLLTSKRLCLFSSRKPFNLSSSRVSLFFHPSRPFRRITRRHSKNTKTWGSAAELLIYTSALLDVLMETTSVQTRKEKLEKAEHKRLFCTASEKWVKFCCCFPESVWGWARALRSVCTRGTINDGDEFN